MSIAELLAGAGHVIAWAANNPVDGFLFAAANMGAVLHFMRKNLVRDDEVRAHLPLIAHTILGQAGALFCDALAMVGAVLGLWSWVWMVALVIGLLVCEELYPHLGIHFYYARRRRALAVQFEADLAEVRREHPELQAADRLAREWHERIAARGEH